MLYQWPNTDYGASWARGAANNRADRALDYERQNAAAVRDQATAAQMLRERQFSAIQGYRQQQMDIAQQLRLQRAEALKALIQETQGTPAPSAGVISQPSPSAAPTPTPSAADALAQPSQTISQPSVSIPDTTSQTTSSAEGESGEDAPLPAPLPENVKEVSSAGDSLPHGNFEDRSPVKTTDATLPPIAPVEASAADALRKPTLPSLTTNVSPAPAPIVTPSQSPADVLRRKQRLIALGTMAGLPASAIAALARTEGSQKPINTTRGTITTFPDGHSITNAPLPRTEGSQKPINTTRGTITTFPDGHSITNAPLPKINWSNVNGVLASNGVPVLTNMAQHVLSPGSVLQQGPNTVASNVKPAKPDIDLQSKETEKILAEQVKSLSGDLKNAQSKDRPEIQRQISRINLKRQQLFAKPATDPAAGNGASQVLPFPKSKDEAVKGNVYQTKAGPMQWDGEQFVPAQ